MSTGRGPRRGLVLAITRNGRHGVSTEIDRTPRREALGRRSLRLVAAACALAGSVLVAGSVTAYQLNREDVGKTVLVTPRRSTPTVSGQWLRLKLATPEGRRALEFG
jgi:hypothetical protein